MTKLTLATLALAAFIVPGASYAAMYAYVDQSGDVMEIQASTATEALMTAPAIDENSGVLIIDSQADANLVDGEVAGVSVTGDSYAYVSQSGDVVEVEASTAAEAFMSAPGIDENSGVIKIDSQSDANIVGDEVPGV